MYELTAAETSTPAQMETDQHATIKVQKERKQNVFIGSNDTFVWPYGSIHVYYTVANKKCIKMCRQLRLR